MGTTVTNKNGIEFDIDALATDVNGKADKDLSNTNPSSSFCSMLMPDYANGTPFTGTSFTAPCAGLAIICNNNASTIINVQVNGVSLFGQTKLYMDKQIFLDKGDVLAYTGGTTDLSNFGGFYPFKGQAT